MWDPRLGIRIHGRMRNRGLSMTGGSVFLRRVGVHPMKRSGGARDQVKPCMASGRPAAIVDGVAHLGADEGPLAEIVVAGDGPVA